MPFYPQEVANDFEKILETHEEYDVIIYAGENEDVREIHAHSLVLRARSQYFRTAFSKNWSEKKDGKFIFKKPNISPQLFNIILRFIYCGKIYSEKLQGPDILNLFIAVDEINIQTLVDHIQEKICEEPEILFNSNTLFIGLKAHLLELLLKRDDLLLDEIDIWDNLIKWCLAQNSNISQDVTQWSKEEITIMESTIRKFIPLIRFYHLSSEDFISKVYPFKEIMPKDLVNNILMFHMAPSKKQNITNIQPPRKSIHCDYSIIINDKHIAIFSSWIEKKNYSYYNVRNIPYNFNLLYRASRDGNTNTAFHGKCDNKGATIVIIKIKDSEQIVGGYNPLYWDSSCTYKSTYDSFLFSFTNKNNFQNAKVVYSNGDRYSIGNYSGHGPVFGIGNDLTFLGGNWSSTLSSSYPKIDIPEINSDDYEVFQVIKK